MRALGPIWGLGLTLDRNLSLVLALANVLFAVLFVVVVFRGRRPLDRLLIGLGLFLVLSTASLAGLYYFARTPIRDVQFFLVD